MNSHYIMCIYSQRYIICKLLDMHHNDNNSNFPKIQQGMCLYIYSLNLHQNMVYIMLISHNSLKLYQHNMHLNIDSHIDLFEDIDQICMINIGLVRRMLYIKLDISNIYDRLYCCNMDQDIYCNILVQAQKRRLAMRIILHKHCYNQQHRFVLTVQWRLGIVAHKIQIFCLHRITQDMSLHIAVQSCQHRGVELLDIKEHKFLLKDHHNMEMGIFIHKMLYQHRQSSQQDNILHKDVQLLKIMNYSGIYQRMILSHFRHRMVQDILKHIIGFHLRHTLMADRDIELHKFQLQDLTKYFMNNVKHNTL